MVGFEIDLLSHWQLPCTSKFGLDYRKSQCACHQHPWPGYNIPLVPPIENPDSWNARWE